MHEHPATLTKLAPVETAAMRLELGVRAGRALAMENRGPVRRRVWWIVSSAVVSTCEPGDRRRAA